MRLKQIENDPIIQIRDLIIKRYQDKKVQGLGIDDELRMQWTKRVEKQSKKISCSIAMLPKITEALYVPETALQTMYVQVIVLPLLFNYCLSNRITKLRFIISEHIELLCL